MRIGYGRVSTRDQHPEAQHDALRAAGCEQVFLDTTSGKLASRPELDKALLSANRSGDQLVVTKLDRLGRSLENLIDLSKTLQERGVDLVVLDQGKELTRPANEDHLSLVSAHFTTIRRYTPAFLAVLDLQAAPAAQDLLAAIKVIRTMNTSGARKVPDDAPTSFTRSRWKTLVFAENGTDRGFYEFCALAELKNALRSGDMWVTGSRQFRDFDDYLLAGSDYTAMKYAGGLPLVTANGGEEYLKDRLALLSERLHQVNALASRDELPGC
ncbi:hypothetical protein GCM10023352_17770 [Rothia endophytica]|uniref:Resolvase/invertase-type recombinase catalytic domain-containing protein n=1 Tax=Rothia endophytica TaxID=1324766 RepID=A0ABP9BR86_9MICC